MISGIQDVLVYVKNVQICTKKTWRKDTDESLIFCNVMNFQMKNKCSFYVYLIKFMNDLYCKQQEEN